MVAVTRYATRLDRTGHKEVLYPYGGSDEVYHQTRASGQREVLYLYGSSGEVYH